MSEILIKLERIRAGITSAANACGRRENEIELVAVSKMHPPEAVRTALDAGQMLFGESRVQEARVKIPLLPSAARWHFIGHLQKNKIRQALPLFEMFHGVDSLALAGDINRIAGECGALPRLLLEVNVAGESSKFGFSPDRLRCEMESLLALDRLQIEGLMTIPPFSEKAEDSRRYFAALRGLRDELQQNFRVPLGHLSMGMSHDYAVAIEEGATLVRVGTAIFGERRAKNLQAMENPPEG
jgi:pyridoxal phosphate enzyme (YggS family)